MCPYPAIVSSHFVCQVLQGFEFRVSREFDVSFLLTEANCEFQVWNSATFFLSLLFFLYFFFFFLGFVVAFSLGLCCLMEVEMGSRIRIDTKRERKLKKKNQEEFCERRKKTVRNRQGEDRVGEGKKMDFK